MTKSKSKKKPEYIEIVSTRRKVRSGKLKRVVSSRRSVRTGKPKRLTKLINDPPLLVSVKDAQDLVGYKRSKLFKMLSDGTLTRVKAGNSTRVTMASIMAFVEGRS